MWPASIYLNHANQVLLVNGGEQNRMIFYRFCSVRAIHQLNNALNCFNIQNEEHNSDKKIKMCSLKQTVVHMQYYLSKFVWNKRYVYDDIIFASTTKREKVLLTIASKEKGRHY